jgi:hypothetical protein
VGGSIVQIGHMGEGPDVVRSFFFFIGREKKMRWLETNAMPRELIV